MPTERLNPYVLSKKDEESMSLSKWAWDSHYWREKYSGCFTCDWCGRNHTSCMAIYPSYPLCENNPTLKAFIKKAKEE